MKDTRLWHLLISVEMYSEVCVLVSRPNTYKCPVSRTKPSPMLCHANIRYSGRWITNFTPQKYKIDVTDCTSSRQPLGTGSLTRRRPTTGSIIKRKSGEKWSLSIATAFCSRNVCLPSRSHTPHVVQRPCSPRSSPPHLGVGLQQWPNANGGTKRGGCCYKNQRQKASRNVMLFLVQVSPDNRLMSVPASSTGSSLAVDVVCLPVGLLAGWQLHLQNSFRKKENQYRV